VREGGQQRLGFHDQTLHHIGRILLKYRVCTVNKDSGVEGLSLIGKIGFFFSVR